MASDSPAAIEAVLRRCEMARTNNFDLLQDKGYEALRVELAADFPYLTLADLNAIVKLGIKGKLDTYKNRPLNFTRVYQWVEQRAPFSLGYWQAQHPVLLGWVAFAGMSPQLLAELDTYETPAAAFALPHKMRQLIQTVIRRACFPAYKAGDYYLTPETAGDYPAGAAAYAVLRDELHPAFVANHPEEAHQHTPLF